MRTPVTSPNAPKPRGPYSPAMIASGPTVYVSAQGAYDPATNEFVKGTFAEEADRVFRNVGALLEAAGSSWANAVKVTVFLADFADFAAMNEVYLRYIQEPYPARSTVHSAIGASRVAVDCVAVIG